LGTAATVVALVLVVAACGSSNNDDKTSTSSGGSGGASAKKDLTFTYANYTDSSPLFAPVVAGAKKAAATAGIKLETFDNKGVAETALQNAQLMVQDKPDVVIEYSPDTQIGKSLFQVFDRAGVKCLALNIPVEGCPWLNIINQKLGVAAGEIAADYATKHGWNGSNTSVVLANAPQSGVEVNDTVRYAYVTLADKVDGFTKIAPADFKESTTRIGPNAVVVSGGTSIDAAFSSVQTALQNIPKGRNIIYLSVNDDMASGGWRAITSAGRDKTSVVAGMGGSEAALKQLRSNPRWIGEIDALVSAWGYYAVAMADALADGATPPKLTELPFLALTKDNLDQYYGASLAAPKALPEPVASNKYLFGRGILEAYGK
jgi:ribose transport system substrate-binding protein